MRRRWHSPHTTPQRSVCAVRQRTQRQARRPAKGPKGVIWPCEMGGTEGLFALAAAVWVLRGPLRCPIPRHLGTSQQRIHSNVPLKVSDDTFPRVELRTGLQLGCILKNTTSRGRPWVGEPPSSAIFSPSPHDSPLPPHENTETYKFKHSLGNPHRRVTHHSLKTPET